MNQNPLKKVDASTAEPVRDEAPRPRRPYTMPRLTAFGSVSALTGGGSGVMMEGAAMTSMVRFP